MRESGSGRVKVCEFEQVGAAMGGQIDAFLTRSLYEIRMEIEVGGAVLPVRRLQVAPPKSAVGDTVDVEWQNRRLWRVVNRNTGEVLLDRRTDAVALAVVSAAALLVLAVAVAAYLASR